MLLSAEPSGHPAEPGWEGVGMGAPLRAWAVGQHRGAFWTRYSPRAARRPRASASQPDVFVAGIRRFAVFSRNDAVQGLENMTRMYVGGLLPAGKAVSLARVWSSYGW